ncbi:MAG TPA: methyltransferase [Kofleriaceae bacterium]|jgi:SAM-dependent methyltransferase|nr:methyltransferase [Kofleriaceae bacterium]
MNARALLSVLFHADKALDLVATARDLGVLAQLDAGPATLRELADMTGARPLRMYKFLDGLESLGLITREQPTDDLLSARYASREPLIAAVEAVLGEGSIERDRNAYPWRDIHGRLASVLSGQLDARFAWPPASAEEVRGFEHSMAAGTPPIIEALRGARAQVFGARDAGPRRWLDVGGGDGTVAAALLREDPRLVCDVYNLASVEGLVRDRAAAQGLAGRLGFVAGDFLVEPLPRGYDVLSFIRVLHDWPADVARMLLRRAADALAPGARIVICEEFRTPDRLAVQLFWTYFLIGVDGCISQLREAAWYVDALAALGFTEITVLPGAPGAFEIVVAVRA